MSDKEKKEILKLQIKKLELLLKLIESSVDEVKTSGYKHNYLNIKSDEIKK